MALSTLYEWLEINQYTIKQSPSNAGEMVQIGALCFSSKDIYQEDLKMAIVQHPLWSFPTLSEPPIIHLTKSDFLGPEKSTNMIFVCSGRSKQVEVGDFFSRLYNGTSKDYPNGIMMLYIPLNDNIIYEPEYRQKVIFNHEHYLGGEAALCIQGLADLNTKVILKNNTYVSLCLLLRSLPASKGMQTSQLFRLVEQSNSGNVILTMFYAKDQEYLSNRKLTLKSEIRQLLPKGEAGKAFQSEVDGIWFNNVSKIKNGNIRKIGQTSKLNLEHIHHTTTILSSSPKKRTIAPQQQQPSTRSQSDNHTQHCAPQQTGPTYAQTAAAHPVTNAIQSRFIQGEQEITNQKEWNIKMDVRMSNLESTTKSTDNKIDTVLSMLEYWGNPLKCRGILHNNDERAAPSLHQAHHQPGANHQ